MQSQIADPWVLRPLYGISFSAVHSQSRMILTSLREIFNEPKTFCKQLIYVPILLTSYLDTIAFLPNSSVRYALGSLQNDENMFIYLVEV